VAIKRGLRLGVGFSRIVGFATVAVAIGLLSLLMRLAIINLLVTLVSASPVSLVLTIVTAIVVGVSALITIVALVLLTADVPSSGVGATAAAATLVLVTL
jgi:hypothetical protein